MHPEHCFLTMVFVFEQYGTDHIDYSFEEGGGGVGKFPIKKIPSRQKLLEKNRPSGAMG